VAIRFACPQCSKLLKAPDAGAGKAGKCPSCDTKFRVPAASQTTGHERERFAFDDKDFRTSELIQPPPIVTSESPKRRPSRAASELIAPTPGAGKAGKYPSRDTRFRPPAANQNAAHEHERFAFDDKDFPTSELVQPPPIVPSESSKRRPCPACGELIAPAAVKCRFCGEIFDASLKGNRLCVEARDALILAIFGIFCLGIVFEPWALIKASQARQKISADPTLTGRGMATAATIIASIVLVLSVLYVLLVMIAALSGQSHF
jgi:hypothetical protein